MELSFEEAKSILATCPIGYYLGKGIKAELTRENATYANLAESSIHISYPNIMQAVRNSKDPDAVKVCRNLMYHEISHIILTPLDYKKGESEEIADALNIFEDERIETILNSFYMGTNFDEFKYQFNGVDPKNVPKPKDAREAFYNIVRFHSGKSMFVGEVSRIIKRYRDISRFSDSSDVYDYVAAVRSLYWNVKKYFKLEQSVNQQNQPKQQQNNPTPSLEQNEQPSKTEEEIKEEKDNEEIHENLIKSLGGRKAPEEMLKDFQEAVAKAFHKNDSALDEAIQKIFEDALRRKKNLSGNRYGYDGRIDPMRVANPNSRYKWFERDSDDRHGNGGDNIVLNLWVDCSSSFEDSEEIINDIIRSLINLEQREKRFTLNVISCSNGEKLLDRDKRFVKCDSWNWLTSNVFNIYKKVNSGYGASIQNLVVFDGSNGNASCEPNNAGFNHSNVFIISDTDNERRFRQYAPQAKKVFCHNGYAEILRDKVIETLKQMYR